jgi:L-ascorbate metabolism protein UlaG (beta-lactamase superfamily)
LSLTYRWLGTAGLVLQVGNQRLAVDPFFSRPSPLQLLQPLKSNPNLVKQYLPECDFVLVTHSHYDHLMDVPALIQQTDAKVNGSENTSLLLNAVGVPPARVHQVEVGDRLSLGEFEVEVIQGQHSPIPLGWLFNGRLEANLNPPRFAWDYKMDVCLGYRITVHGTRFLVCAAEPQPADVLFLVAQEPLEYYTRLLSGVQPKRVVPIHWDDFTRPLNRPQRRFTRPGRISVDRLSALVHQIMPVCQVSLPSLFIDYPLGP